MKKNLSSESNIDELEQLDMFEKEGKKSADTSVSYKDLDLEIVQSTRKKFLTWDDF